MNGRIDDEIEVLNVNFVEVRGSCVEMFEDWLPAFELIAHFRSDPFRVIQIETAKIVLIYFRQCAHLHIASLRKQTVYNLFAAVWLRF